MDSRRPWRLVRTTVTILVSAFITVAALPVLQRWSDDLMWGLANWVPDVWRYSIAPWPSTMLKLAAFALCGATMIWLSRRSGALPWQVVAGLVLGLAWLWTSAFVQPFGGNETTYRIVRDLAPVRVVGTLGVLAGALASMAAANHSASIRAQ